MKAMKNVAGVSPVIAVILMVAITVVLAGVVFLWAQSFTNKAGSDVEGLNIKAKLDSNQISVLPGPAVYSALQIDAVQGKIDWTKYKISINGAEVYDQAATNTAPVADANSLTANAGDVTYFSNPAYLSTATPLTSGTEYSVKIINVGDNKVIWEAKIICLA